MAKVSLSTIKGWFITKAKISQNQFWDTWDSFFHKDELIPTSQIDGLDDLLATIPTSEEITVVNELAPKLLNVSGSATYTLAAGKLMEKVSLDVGATGTFKIGTTANGSEIYEDNVTDGDSLLWLVDFYTGVEATIHFTGTASVKIYIR